MTIVKNFKFQESQLLAQVKIEFYEHYEYLIHKTHLADVWAMFFGNEMKYAELEAGNWVEINEDVMIRKCQESGELRWNPTEKYLEADWAREMDLAAQREQEQLGDDSWDDVNAAVSGGAMLRVCRTEEGFEIILRPKNKKQFAIHLYTNLKKGGLFTADEYPFLETYEFSMHMYQSQADTRAATEYVRRKLNKKIARVLKSRGELEGF